MPRIGVDGVAEQQQLDERNHDDHRKRNTVALELDEFFHEDGPGPAQEIAVDPPRRLPWQHVTHWKLSRALPIRSMKTSSSEGSERCHSKSLRFRYGAIAASSLPASRPDTCRLVPNGATMSMPALLPSSSP